MHLTAYTVRSRVEAVKPMPLTIGDIAKVFDDEAEAYQLMERIRWPDGPVCPHCGTKDDAHFIEPKSGEASRTRTRADGSEKKSTSYRRVWRCHACKKQFTVIVGTIFGESHIPLAKWLMAFHLLCSGKNGVSAHELHRQLGITVKSAWFMAHRIRYAMQRPPLSDKLAGTVEADETYMGGKIEGGQKRRLLNKVPVVTVISRETGEARSHRVQAVTAKNLGRVLSANIEKSATLETNKLPSYKNLGRKYAKHESVDHGKGEYVRGTAHINTVEGFFSQLNRSIDGTHHHVSERHLPRYLAVFDYRYTTRGTVDAVRTEQAIRKSAGKRLAYR
jgi:transposase-like protein